MDRHWDENTKVLVWQVQFPLETNFLLKLIYPSLRNNTKMTTLPTLYNYGKTRFAKYKHILKAQKYSILMSADGMDRSKL